MAARSRRQTPAAVVVGLCAHGLATARSLASFGVQVHALESNQDLPGVRTSSATVHAVNAIHGPPMIEALLQLAGDLDLESLPVLFATNDKMVECIAMNWPQLENAYQLSWAHRREEVLRLLQKTNLEQHCADRNLLYPASSTISSVIDLKAGFDNASFPMIVKPSKPLGSFKTRLVRSYEELVDVAERYQADFPLVAQRWIDGDDKQLYFCGLYLRNGQILARFDGHKLRSLPPALGQTLVAEPVDDEEVFAVTSHFFSDTDLSGPVSLEIKRDASSRIWIVEPTVGRTDYWLSTCIENGIPFPIIEYCDVVGLEYEPGERGRIARWFDTERDPLCYISYASANAFSIGRERAVFPYLDKSDLRPFYRAMGATFRRLLESARRRIKSVFSVSRETVRE